MLSTPQGVSPFRDGGGEPLDYGIAGAMGDSDTSQRFWMSTNGCLMPLRSDFTWGLAAMYACICDRIWSFGWPLRPLKKPFTSGWVNRYVDIDAETPEETPAMSAAVQFGGGSANAAGTALNSVAPASAPMPITAVAALLTVRGSTTMTKLLCSSRQNLRT